MLPVPTALAPRPRSPHSAGSARPHRPVWPCAADPPTPLRPARRSRARDGYIPAGSSPFPERIRLGMAVPRTDARETSSGLRSARKIRLRPATVAPSNRILRTAGEDAPRYPSPPAGWTAQASKLTHQSVGLDVVDHPAVERLGRPVIPGEYRA